MSKSEWFYGLCGVFVIGTMAFIIIGIGFVAITGHNCSLRFWLCFGMSLILAVVFWFAGNHYEDMDESGKVRILEKRVRRNR